MKASEQLFEAIKQKAKHPKSVKALENIKAACDYLDNEDGARRPKLPITVRDVGEFTGKQPDGPITPSIRNNKKYVEYIRQRANEQKLPPIADASKPSEFRTGNIEIDSQLYAQQVEIRILKKQLGALRSAIGNGKEYDVKRSLSGERRLILKSGTEVVNHVAPAITPELRETIVKILDPKALALVGLALENGRIKCPEHNSREFLNKTDVEWLRKAAQWNTPNENGSTAKPEKRIAGEQK